MPRCVWDGAGPRVCSSAGVAGTWRAGCCLGEEGGPGSDLGPRLRIPHCVRGRPVPRRVTMKVCAACTHGNSTEYPDNTARLLVMIARFWVIVGRLIATAACACSAHCAESPSYYSVFQVSFCLKGF